MKSQCIRCNANYYLNSEGKCVKISDDDCSIISILNNFPERLSICENYCSNSGKTKYVQATYKNNTNNGSLEILMNSLEITLIIIIMRINIIINIIIIIWGKNYLII